MTYELKFNFINQSFFAHDQKNLTELHIVAKLKRNNAIYFRFRDGCISNHSLKLIHKMREMIFL